MIRQIKRRLYFVAAFYFAFWAKFVLLRWRPRIVLITGSSGKTTVLHLIESQLGEKAVYTHHANGAISIPFHILGMPTNVSIRASWPAYFLTAPLHIFRKVPKTKLYIVEADCDRPKEGKFSANFLKPEVSIWVSSSRTHSMNFTPLVKSARFASFEEAIAYEFGFFPAATKKLVLANGDQTTITNQLNRVEPGVKQQLASIKDVENYRLSKSDSVFKIKGQTIQVPGLQPKKLGVSLQLVNELLDYLELPLDPDYKRLELPPGRSKVLKGLKGTTLIDSTYNTGLDATAGIVELFSNYPYSPKWLVIGDILEQGSLDESEHQDLAKLLSDAPVTKLILLGRRTKRYTYPLLKNLNPKFDLKSFEGPKELLSYLSTELKGGEVVLFKGAQGLEGVVEQLLDNPDDARLLVRREKNWVKRRQAWGLPR